MTIKIKGKEYYMMKDLLEMLPLTNRTICQYLREGRIRGKKLGIKWYVSNIDLERFLDSGSRDSVKIIKKLVQS